MIFPKKLFSVFNFLKFFRIREQLNTLLAQGPKDKVTKISINDFIIKVCFLFY